MLGDPGYDPAPLVIQVGSGSGDAPDREQLRQDFELFATVVAEPVDRLLAWATAREVESALWNVAHDEYKSAIENMALACVRRPHGALKIYGAYDRQRSYPRTESRGRVPTYQALDAPSAAEADVRDGSASRPASPPGIGRRAGAGISRKPRPQGVSGVLRG